MMKSRACAIAAFCVALAGCSASNPTNPGPSLTGQAIVRADLKNEVGAPQGTRDYLTMSGLSVQLFTDSVLTQSGVIKDGTFSFSRYKPGLEMAVAIVAGVPIDSTEAVGASGPSTSFPTPLIFGTYGPISVWPNPVGTRALVVFALPKADTVSVQITTLTGAVVRLLASRVFTAGEHALTWDGSTDAGSAAAPGVYWAWVDRHTSGPNPSRLGPAGLLGPPQPGPTVPDRMCTVVIKQ